MRLCRLIFLFLGRLTYIFCFIFPVFALCIKKSCKLSSYSCAVRRMSYKMGSVSSNLVPRAHVPFGQHQDTELWNNQFPETKI